MEKKKAGYKECARRVDANDACEAFDGKKTFSYGTNGQCICCAGTDPTLKSSYDKGQGVYKRFTINN